jgi:hypothetical protein
MNTLEYMNKFEGGKVIDSGGYGCIFTPSLKCSGSQQNNNEISKLMENKYTYEEYNTLIKFKSLLQNVPNYTNYFLLDGITKCHPEYITQNDLIDYKKCDRLIESGINETNINQRLNEISTINMPYGGRSVEPYIMNNLNSNKLLELNNSLINLLINGIIPMNNLNIYHCDLKGSNVLVENKNNITYTRIIDWGLSFINDKFYNINSYNINNILEVRRPFQFNLPFSCVLFSETFIKNYNIFYEKNPEITYLKIQKWIVNFLNEIVKSNRGHLSTIKLIVNQFNVIKSNFFKNNKLITANDYIVNYLTNIVNKYTNKFKLDIIKNANLNISQYILKSYFNEVYLKNVDIWGFVSIYLELFDVVYKNKKLMKKNIYLLNKIKQIIINHLYLNSTKPINITKLIDDLKILNTYIKRFKNEMSSVVDNLIRKKGGKIITRSRSKLRSTSRSKSKFIKTKKHYKIK